LRICYLGESTSIHDLRFIRKLVEKGYDTHVVTFAPEPVKIYGASYHRFPQLEDPQKHSRLMGDLIFLRNLVCYRSFLRRLLKEIKPDILHAGWIPSHGLVAVVSGFHPLLLMPWGSDILILPNNLLSNRMITRYVINKADMITCDAEHVKREIIKLSGYPEDRITIFPWGIDLGKFSPNNGDQEIRRKLGWEDGKVLIMTRNLKPIYGVGYFLQALPHIISRHPQVKVILCG